MNDLRQLVWDLEHLGSAYWHHQITEADFIERTAPLWAEAEKRGWTKNVMLLLAIDAH